MKVSFSVTTDKGEIFDSVLDLTGRNPSEYGLHLEAHKREIHKKICPHPTSVETCVAGTSQCDICGAITL